MLLVAAVMAVGALGSRMSWIDVGSGCKSITWVAVRLFTPLTSAF
jgi:hypothetical protein